jgi:hypothetical protein
MRGNPMLTHFWAKYIGFLIPLTGIAVGWYAKTYSDNHITTNFRNKSALFGGRKLPPDSWYP